MTCSTTKAQGGPVARLSLLYSGWEMALDFWRSHFIACDTKPSTFQIPHATCRDTYPGWICHPGGSLAVPCAQVLWGYQVCPLSTQRLFPPNIFQTGRGTRDLNVPFLSTESQKCGRLTDCGERKESGCTQMAGETDRQISRELVTCGPGPMGPMPRGGFILCMDPPMLG